MLGVGGGFIIVPALGYFSELRMHSIVATSLLVIALLSAVTVFITFGQSLSLTAPTWAFSAVALVGMAGARFLGAKIPSTALQRIFAIACIVRLEDHTTELQSLMRTSYAVFTFKTTNNI